MAAQPRFREPDGLAWRDPVYVACPRCKGRATVRSQDRCTARMVCASCALTRDWSHDRLFVLVDGHPVELRRDHGAWMNAKTGQYVQHYETPQGQDPRFGVPLWLRIGCCGGQLLWANNQDHLAYLEAYVGAGLRERPEGPANLAWYLPAWMKEAKHREEVLAGAGDNVLVLLDAGAHAAACTVHGGTAAAAAAAAGYTEIADAINSAMKDQAQ